MQANGNIEFARISKEDVPAMTKIMKRAFDEDTRRHLGREAGGPPGYDNGEFINKWYLESGADARKILLDGKMIGGFNVFMNGRENFLGNIFIDPDLQDQGYGTYIWKRIESMYPNTTKWSTETPGFSKRNHNFYVNKCGFHIVKIENPKDLEEESYILQKVMSKN